MGENAVMEAGRELDALVAEKIMGLGQYHTPETHYEVIGCGAGCSFCIPPPYSTDIAAAWQVVEKLSMSGFWIIKSCRVSAPGKDDWIEWDVMYQNQRAIADALPFAICLAALNAVNT